MAKRITYDVICSLNPGESVPSIKEFEEILNAILSTHGIANEYHIETDFPLMEMSVSRNLNKEEEKTILKVLRNEFSSSDVLSSVSVKRLSRKSSSQSSQTR